MKYFLDTEFSESGNAAPIVPISIGIVAEDGREFYAVSSEFDESQVNDFVRENVLPLLGDVERQSLEEIKAGVLEFIGEDTGLEVWAWKGAYDWVVFAQLFGTMVEMPENIPHHVNDLATLLLLSGLDDDVLPEEDETVEHNALEDARWNARAYRAIMEAVTVESPDGA